MTMVILSPSRSTRIPARRASVATPAASPGSDFAVANAREDSGDETTLVVLDGAGEGIPGVLARHSGTALVAVPGFLRAGDPALEAVRAAYGARSAAVIGGYANPIKG